MSVVIFNDFFRLLVVVGAFWILYLTFSGFFFKFYSFFYNDYKVPEFIFVMEPLILSAGTMSIIFLLINVQTLPITAMILLRNKLELLCEEFKNLKYQTEEQFDEDIAKVVDYHEYLIK